jgi:hypothetical protein
MTTQAAARMLARFVRKGGNAETGAALLAELTASHDGDNLAAALSYNGFTA